MKTTLISLNPKHFNTDTPSVISVSQFKAILSTFEMTMDGLTLQSSKVFYINCAVVAECSFADT
jgi:hypothetical protein